MAVQTLFNKAAERLWTYNDPLRKIPGEKDIFETLHPSVLRLIAPFRGEIWIEASTKTTAGSRKIRDTKSKY